MTDLCVGDRRKLGVDAGTLSGHREKSRYSWKDEQIDLAQTGWILTQSDSRRYRILIQPE